MPDINAIVSAMTLEEKAALVTGASAWTTTPIERLGVPELLMSDGPHGIRRVPDIHAMGPSQPAVHLQPLALASSCCRNPGLRPPSARGGRGAGPGGYGPGRPT